METMSLQGKTIFLKNASVNTLPTKLGIGVDHADQSFAFALDASF
jgi:hypothetical protein